MYKLLLDFITTDRDTAAAVKQQQAFADRLAELAPQLQDAGQKRRRHL